MAALTLIIGSVVVFAGTFTGWYTAWHRRIWSRFERIPVGDGRSAHVLRRDVMPGGDGR